MSHENLKPRIIAHRGSSELAPENTIAAFSRALEDKTEGIEFDVRLTRDGIPVVFHDASLKRFTGVDTRVSSLRFDELIDVDAGSWFNSLNPDAADLRFIGEKIPTLETTLEFLRNFKGTIYIELKATQRNMRRLAAAVGEIVRVYAGRRHVIVKSFQLEIIPFVTELCPDIETAALFAPNIMRILQKEKRLVSIAQEFSVDRLSLHFSLATRKLMALAESAKLPVTIWTADSPRWIKRSRVLGIDSVITNNPAKLLDIRSRVTASA